MSSNAVSRRNALGGAATVGLGLPLLAACSDGEGSSPVTDRSAAPSRQPAVIPARRPAPVLSRPPRSWWAVA